MRIARRAAIVAIIVALPAAAQEGVTVTAVADVPTQAELNRWLPAGTPLRVAAPLHLLWQDRAAVPLESPDGDRPPGGTAPLSPDAARELRGGEPVDPPRRTRLTAASVAEALLGPAGERESMLDPAWRAYLEERIGRFDQARADARAVYLVGDRGAMQFAAQPIPLQRRPAGDQILLLALTADRAGVLLVAYRERDRIVDVELAQVAWDAAADATGEPVPVVLP